MSDKTQGLYHKFNVTRTDGRSEHGEKHDECRYIVLDVEHDPHARETVKTYAWLVFRDGYLNLALDLFVLANHGRGAAFVRRAIAKRG